MTSLSLVIAAIAILERIGLGIAEDTEGQQATARHWTPPAISTEGYESSPTFTPDGQEIYYVSADAGFRRYRILHSRCEGGQWGAPEPVSFAAPEPVIEADPFITPDGKRIYFVSARHDPRNEDFDIWRADRLANGEWSEPERLPYPINSPATELLPRQSADGVLVFGSARPGGFGQSDIYFGREGTDGSWTVENSGAPISTAANEYEADISRDGRTLVVVADRGDLSHLYSFTRTAEGWREIGRVPARPDVFQVGPTLSPDGRRLLFAQADPGRSGEVFLIDLRTWADPAWPPSCSVAPK